jgi:aryl-alcohol dehydrogenase-like predicted oxidoreductase
MRLPTIKDQASLDVEESTRVLLRAQELGVNYFDTAPSYCNGESEIVVGKALKGIRDNVYISTKNSIQNASGYDWRRQLDSSLKNLDTSYIDFYHMWGD